MSLPLRIAYVIDPRFPGGTSAAVAAELREVSREGRISVHAIRSGMFGPQPVSPQIEAVLADLGLSLIWAAPEIAADLVILHNPLFLKRESVLPPGSSRAIWLLSPMKTCSVPAGPTGLMRTIA